MKRQNRKGIVSLGDMPALFMGIILSLAVGIAGFLIITGLADSTTNTDATNAANNATAALSNTFDYLPTVGIVVGVAILLGIVIVGFGMAQRNGYL